MKFFPTRSDSAARRSLRAGLVGCAALLLACSSALALSEIKQDQVAPAPEAAQPAPASPGPGPETTAPAAPDAAAPADPARPDVDPDEPPPEVIYNLDKLPEPVRRMHDRLIEAARTGDPEKLRPLIGTGDDATQLSFGDAGTDPIAFLKSLSGDPDGQEILAILEEVLSAGYVHLDAGTDSELYVWPYFFALPLDKLTPPQKVELFKIMTAGDYEEMKSYGTYVFYRLGIDPEGRWAFFVAGD